MARRPKPAGGAPEWIVTFADLMSLLLCFFILLISFSTQDKQKVQLVVGSMREAFGSQPIPRKAGMIEPDGTPERVFLRNLTNKQMVAETSDNSKDDTVVESRPDERPDSPTSGSDTGLTAAALSLRRALEAWPELTELSRQVLFEETNEGLEITLIDHDGRAMFGAGGVEPQDRVRDIIIALAPQLRALPNRISISGYAARGEPGGANDPAFDLSSRRASSILALLVGEGVAGDRFARIAGRGANEPFFPEAPELAANRRVTILLHKTPPPLPLGHEL